MPPLTPPPASHIVKPWGLWSRPSPPCARRRAAELAAPHHQRVVEQAACFRSRQQPRDRLIHLAGVVRDGRLETIVLVPAARRPPTLIVTTRQRHGNDQPAGDEAHGPILARASPKTSTGALRAAALAFRPMPYSSSVFANSRLTSSASGRCNLHAEGQLSRGNARCQVVPAFTLPGVDLVELTQQVELPACCSAVTPCGRRGFGIRLLSGMPCVSAGGNPEA